MQSRTLRSQTSKKNNGVKDALLSLNRSLDNKTAEILTLIKENSELKKEIIKLKHQIKRMPMKQLMILFLSVILFSSCAKNITVTAGTGNGSITMKPTKATPKTYVTVNDKLIVDKKNVKSVTVTGLSDGDNKIVYKSESSIYKEPLAIEKNINIENGSDKTEIVTVPPYSTGYWLYTLGSPIVLLIVLGATL